MGKYRYSLLGTSNFKYAFELFFQIGLDKGSRGKEIDFTDQVLLYQIFVAQCFCKLFLFMHNA